MSLRWSVVPRGLDATQESAWPAIAALVGARDLAVMSAEHGIMEREVSGPGLQAPADILSTRQSGVALLALAADCVPVALDAGDEVVVVHAGWRGVLAGAVPAALAGRSVTSAVVGPAICAECYEVSPELAARFAALVPAASAGPRHVDLVAGVEAQLLGVPTHVVRRCTRHDAELYSLRGGDLTARGGLVAVLE